MLANMAARTKSEKRQQLCISGLPLSSFREKAWRSSVASNKAKIVAAAFWGASIAMALDISAAEAQTEPAVKEIAPGVTSIDGARVRVNSVDLASLEGIIRQTASLASVQQMLGVAEVVSPGPSGTMVHMYRITDTATNAPKLLLVFVQGSDHIVDHLVTDRTP
jgi:hypothetical protein